MTPNQKVKDAVGRLKNDSDFRTFVAFLVESRNVKVEEMEDAGNAIRVHQLQGYCQALRDLIRLGS